MYGIENKISHFLAYTFIPKLTNELFRLWVLSSKVVKTVLPQFLNTESHMPFNTVFSNVVVLALIPNYSKNFFSMFSGSFVLRFNTVIAHAETSTTTLHRVRDHSFHKSNPKAYLFSAQWVMWRSTLSRLIWWYWPFIPTSINDFLDIPSLFNCGIRCWNWIQSKQTPYRVPQPF